MSADIERLAAERIRSRRTHLHVSMRDLSDRMREAGHDWHHMTVHRTECAKRPIRIAELETLAVVLRTSIADLLGLDDQSDTPAGPAHFQAAALTERAAALAKEVDELTSRVAVLEKAGRTASRALDTARQALEATR